MSSRPCAACGGAVVLTEPHLTVNRHVEMLRAGALDVLDAQTITTLHLRCGWAVGERVEAGAETEGVLADRPIPYVLTESAVRAGCHG